MSLYPGLVSGTDMDGIDAVLLDIDAARMQLRSAATRDLPATPASRIRASSF